MAAKPGRKKARKTLGRKSMKKSRGGALPRLGWEVSASFDGDPDRPIVLGQFPNPPKS